MKADTKRLLTADAILRGTRSLVELEIPELPDEEGRPGIMLLRPPTAGAVIRFTETPENERSNAMLELIATTVVNEDGSQLFTPEQIVRLRDELDVRIFTRLSKAVTEMSNTAGPEGAGTVNPSVAEAGGASPTA